MSGPNEILEFDIASIHEGTLLHCRIFHPPVGHHLKLGKGAIVAHPYAPLGGSFDDPVVAIVVREMLQAGFVVGTFNFR